MQEFLNVILLLAVISCGFSIMLWPLTGKKGMDPFLIIRPIIRGTVRFVGSTFRELTILFRGWGRGLWRAVRRPGTSWWAKVPLTLLAVSCTSVGIVCSIPAQLLPTGKKKK